MSLVEKALKAIADGYDYRIQTPHPNHWPTGFIAIDNPDFKEDDGSDPFLVIEYIENAKMV
jgi:hypothetical protein